MHIEPAIKASNTGSNNMIRNIDVEEVAAGNQTCGEEDCLSEEWLESCREAGEEGWARGVWMEGVNQETEYWKHVVL